MTNRREQAADLAAAELRLEDHEVIIKYILKPGSGPLADRLFMQVGTQEPIPVDVEHLDFDAKQWWDRMILQHDLDAVYGND